MPVSGQTDTAQGHNQNNKTVSKKKKAMTTSKQKEGGKKGKNIFTVRVFYSNQKIVKLLIVCANQYFIGPNKSSLPYIGS